MADGSDLVEKLAQAGIGTTDKSSAEDVLARLRQQQMRPHGQFCPDGRVFEEWSWPIFQRLLLKEYADSVRGPLGLHLKAGLRWIPAFRLLEDNLLIELPGEAYTIAATGQIGGGSRIYRYYTSGDEFLQINTTGGADVDDIDDMKLFVYVQSDGISRKILAFGNQPSEYWYPTFSWRQQRWQRF